MQFTNNYDSEVVIYEHKMFIRLVTGGYLHYFSIFGHLQLNCFGQEQNFLPYYLNFAKVAKYCQIWLHCSKSHCSAAIDIGSKLPTLTVGNQSLWTMPKIARTLRGVVWPPPPFLLGMPSTVALWKLPTYDDILKREYVCFKMSTFYFVQICRFYQFEKGTASRSCSWQQNVIFFFFRIVKFVVRLKIFFESY